MLHWGGLAALATVLATFVVYVSRAVPPAVPFEDLPKYWTLPADQYVAATGAPTGWHWLGRLHQGDYLTFVGVAMLALLAAVCYLRVLPIYLRNGDYVYAAIALVEVAVIALAASGLVGARH